MGPNSIFKRHSDRGSLALDASIAVVASDQYGAVIEPLCDFRVARKAQEYAGATISFILDEAGLLSLPRALALDKLAEKEREEKARRAN